MFVTRLWRKWTDEHRRFGKLRKRVWYGRDGGRERLHTLRPETFRQKEHNDIKTRQTQKNWQISSLCSRMISLVIFYIYLDEQKQIYCNKHDADTMKPIIFISIGAENWDINESQQQVKSHVSETVEVHVANCSVHINPTTWQFAPCRPALILHVDQTLRGQVNSVLTHLFCACLICLQLSHVRRTWL